MKKTICLILCLSFIFTLVLGISTASAGNPVDIITQTYTITPTTNGNKITAYAKGAPAKSGYYSSVTVYLSVTYVRGEGLSNAGTKYTKTNQKSANGGWGQGTSGVSTSVTSNNSADYVYSITAKRTLTYYGIR